MSEQDTTALIREIRHMSVEIKELREDLIAARDANEFCLANDFEKLYEDTLAEVWGPAVGGALDVVQNSARQVWTKANVRAMLAASGSVGYERWRADMLASKGAAQVKIDRKRLETKPILE